MSKDLNVTDSATQADFYAEFERTQGEEKRDTLEKYGNCFSAEGDVIFGNITEDDILHNVFLYEYICGLPDEISISGYITELRQTAKRFKLAKDFDSKVKPYRDKAVKALKAAETEEKHKDFLKRTESFPDWWDGQTIDEDLFCVEFLKGKNLKCINNIMYDIDGLYEDGRLENEIYNRIKGFCKKSIADRTKSILRTLKTKCFSPPLEPDAERIHLKNGTLYLDGTFTSEKFFTTNRLNVNYIENCPEPVNWLKYLNDLLEQEDIFTFQEFSGYCLIPTTKGQKMLMIIGKGGEGKSRIGVVLNEIFGSGSLVMGEVKDLDNGNKARFARPKLVSKLVLLDDDLDLSALSATSFLKQLITAEIPLEIEPKGLPSFQARLYSRVIAFGNGAISSLYDKSDGFYRRQIILTAKDKPQDRRDDKYLAEKLIAEKDSIFMWCFEGLQRLIKANYEFTISSRTAENLEKSRREGCNIIDFMESRHDFCYDKNGQAHAKELYWAYENWCSLNALEPLKQKTFTKFLRDNAGKYGIEYTENAKNRENKRARGFIGIRYLKEYNTL